MANLLTPDEVAAAYRKVSLYINSSSSPTERLFRKQRCFPVLYNSSPAQLVEFAKNLPSIPTGPDYAWHVTYYYLATGMEGRPDEEDHGIVMAPTAYDAKLIVARRCSKGDAALESWYMSCLEAVRYHG